MEEGKYIIVDPEKLVIDLAVGVIIGSAFGKIIDSPGKNILMPILGVLLPADQGHIGWKYVVNGKEIPYGLFIGEMVNFIIVAIALFFFIVKFLGWIVKEKKVTAEIGAPSVLTMDGGLLAEIRDHEETSALIFTSIHFAGKRRAREQG